MSRYLRDGLKNEHSFQDVQQAIIKFHNEPGTSVKIENLEKEEFVDADVAVSTSTKTIAYYIMVGDTEISVDEGKRNMAAVGRVVTDILEWPPHKGEEYALIYPKDNIIKTHVEVIFEGLKKMKVKFYRLNEDGTITPVEELYDL
jgi:hypothetical protein